MAVKTQDDLPPDARTLYLKAFTAIQSRNFAYAVTLLQSVLKGTPEFLDGRKMMRKAQIASHTGKKSFLSGLSASSFKGSGMVKKDPLAAIEMAEKMLESDPYNAHGNHLLHDAAKAAGFMETAGFALETLAEGAPKDTKALHQLAEHYTEVGDSDRAVDIYNRITVINPSDLEAVKRGKDSSARASMRSGGWETAKDYRDLIKNKDVAIALEQQNRSVKSEDVIEQQVRELSARMEQEPENLDISRKIAALLEQAGDLQGALTWYEYSNTLAKNADPALARKVSDINLKILESEITAYEQYLANPPEDGDPDLLPQYQEELQRLTAQKAESLISEAEKRVNRNPTDLQFKFELGERLLQADRFKDAIPRLQDARRSPNVRLKAINLLGQCFAGMGMLDMAEKQFIEAKSEIVSMDDTKKDVTYRLGLIYEKMGKPDKTLECMKEIYDADYGYLDVAERVERSYAQ